MQPAMRAYHAAMQATTQNSSGPMDTNQGVWGEKDFGQLDAAPDDISLHRQLISDKSIKL